MSNVIEFLEKLGRDSQLRHATGTEVDQALIRAGIGPVLRAAILDADRCALESLLGASSKVVCAVFAPEEEEKEEEEEGEEKEGEEKEDEAQDANLRSRTGRRVA